MLRMQNKRKYSAESHSIAEKEAEDESNCHLSKIAKWDLTENCIKALDKVAELVPVDNSWPPISSSSSIASGHFDNESSSNTVAVETAANIKANSGDNFNNNNNTIDNNKKPKFINGLYSNTNELIPLKSDHKKIINTRNGNVEEEEEDDEDEDDDDDDDDDDEDDDDDDDEDDDEEDDEEDDLENEHFDNSSNKNCWKVSSRSFNTNSNIESRNYSSTSQQVIIKEDENGKSYLQLGNMKQTKCLASMPNTPSSSVSSASSSSSSITPTSTPQSQPSSTSSSEAVTATSTASIQSHQMPSVSMSMTMSSPCPSPLPTAAQTSQSQSFSPAMPPLPSFSMPSNHAHANSFFSQHPFRKTNPADKYTHCCDTIEKSRVCNNHCYNQKRLNVLNLSMCKLAKFRQNSDSSLIKSVLICNTLRFIEKEMESEGNQYQQQQQHQHQQQQQQQQQHQQQLQHQQMLQTQQMQESQQQMVSSSSSSPPPPSLPLSPQPSPQPQSPVALPHLEWLHVSPSPVPLYASVTQSVLQMPDFVSIEDDNVDDSDIPLPSLSSSFSDYIVPLRSTVAVPVPVTVAVSEYYENSLREMANDSGRMTPFPCSSSFPSPSSSYSNESPSSSSLISMQSLSSSSSSSTQTMTTMTSPSSAQSSTSTLTLFDCQNNSNNNNGDFMDCSDSDIADSASCTTALHSDFGLDSGFDDEDDQSSSINWSTVLTLTSDTHLENLSHNMEFYSETGFAKSANFLQVTPSSNCSPSTTSSLSPFSCPPSPTLNPATNTMPTSTTAINSNLDGEWEEFVFYDNS